MKRSEGRILTTHAGSLPRPADLWERIIDRGSAAGPPPADDPLARRLREAVGGVVRNQVACGVDSVNDGELGKVNFTWYAVGRIGGLELRPPDSDDTPHRMAITARDRAEFPGYFAATTGWGSRLGPAPHVACTAPLTYSGQAAVQADIENFRAALEGVDVGEAFLPSVAPGTIEHWLRNEQYPDEEAHLTAIAEAIGEEYRAIVDAGFVLQVDDPDLLDGWQMFPEMTVADYRRYAALRVEALNHALRGIPADRVRLHVCWGSWHGPHKHDLPLREIVDLILQVDAGAYSIEAANARHDHEWRVWEEVRLPEGKLLVPGVVGHGSDFIEHPELVAERLVRYARLVGRENVLAGTDCGLGGRVGNEEIAWAKLQTLAEGARLASRQLWGSEAD
jgi:5-methyltetrahydropteroyltriglutamate--homocysteine methyltransferase